METALKPVQQADSSRQLEVQKKRLRDSCQEFESVMISYMMKTMRDAVRWDEEPDTAKTVYEDMLSQQVSEEISRSSVLGIGDMLYSKLEPRLETQAPSKVRGGQGETS